MTLALISVLCATSLELGPAEVEIPRGGHESYSRCEPSIAAAGKNVLVAWNDSVGGDHGSRYGTAVGWAWSVDSGKTFHVGGYLNSDWTGADSRIVAAKGGGFDMIVLGVGGIHLYSMSADKMGQISDMGLVVAGDDLDKPAIALDGERMAIAYTKGTGEIFVSRSADGGKSFDAGAMVSSPDKMNRSGASVVYDGPALRVAWTEGKSFAATQVGIASATKSDGDFSAPGVAYRLSAKASAPVGQVMNAYRDAGYALFGYDTGMDVNDGTLQLSVVEGRKDGSRVLVLRSTDGGATWSEPIDVSGLMSTGYNSYATVCSYGGDIAALYYHQSGDSADGKTLVAMTSLSKDASFTATVSSQASDWKQVVGDAKRSPFQRTFGDYISVAENGSGELFAAWTDGRNGVPTIMVRRLTDFPHVRRAVIGG